MFSDIPKFFLCLLLTGGTGFLLHRGIYIYLHPEESIRMIEFAYKFNMGITAVFTTTTILASQQLKEQLGFIFLVSGAIKLGLYVFLIDNQGFSLDKSVFLHFFIPYVLGVVVEMIFIIKILNRTNFSKNS